MRKSLEQLINICHDVKCHLSLAKYELYDYDDGCFVDFAVQRINDPRSLCLLIGQLSFKILHEENAIIIRIFEDFQEN